MQNYSKNKMRHTAKSSVQPLLAEALRLHRSGDLIQAKLAYEKILKVQALHFDALHMLGVIASQNKNYRLSIDLISKALLLHPENSRANYNLGLAKYEVNDFEGAAVSYSLAIGGNPNFHEAYSNLGTALKKLNHLDEALVNYDKAISLNPNSADNYSNKAALLVDMHHQKSNQSPHEDFKNNSPLDHAYANYENFSTDDLAINSAIENYDKAISLNETNANSYLHRGILLSTITNIDAAVESYKKALSINSNLPWVLGDLLHGQMNICDWADYNDNIKKLESGIRNGQKTSPSFVAVTLTSSLELQLQASQAWAASEFPLNHSLGPLVKLPRKNKIRIAYYSADFYSHATCILMAGLFEKHDKSKFELFAFSFGPAKNDSMRERVAAAFDQFIDVSSNTDKEIAEFSRMLGIDIAIDLKGSTKDHQFGIFSYRAAPIQASYIGYPGSMGADYIDYLIADKTLIPQHSQHFYTEKIAYLPHSYQVNDRNRVIADRDFTKQELGLPHEGFVFCSFNSNYKITPEVFDVWARILQAVPGSVLWLLVGNETAAHNLRNEAQMRGLAPDRLVFAPRMLLPEHLSRHKLADLFLDTWPCNAHTTASDALWAGLPVLTCMGEGFASRVAGSLLNAIEMPELITETLEDYEAMAIDLALQPAKLQVIKKNLEANKLTTPLFDTDLFTKHIENAYCQMYARYHEELGAAHIYIDADLNPPN